MPFKSMAQLKYLFAKKPKIAEEFAEHTPDIKSLPKKVKKKKSVKKVVKNSQVKKATAPIKKTAAKAIKDGKKEKKR